ncbi:MAG: phage/plasmid replication domain-containing protein [Methylobacter sp.]
MFFDWLACYQDFDFELPVVSKEGYAIFNFEDGSFSPIRQNRIQHEGSFSTSVTVKVSGNRIYVSGNPSRFDRLDNLFGFTTLEACFAVYNRILASLGLPAFTRGKLLGYVETERENGSIKLVPLFDGAVITELHLTSNVAVGKGNELTYLKAVSMLPYRHSVPRLHTNGMTVDWLSKAGNAREVYPKIYNKANEFRLHLLPNIKKRFGENSQEYQYVLSVINYCESQGVVRFEQKLRSGFLKKNGLQYWGLSNFSYLETIHYQFINIDEKLKVSAMNIQTLTETLLTEGICSNTKAANITALYAINWMNGEKFESGKAQVKVHRARLRKIGIDILKPCNLLVFSPVIVKEVVEIEKRPLTPPPFYRHPAHLSLVA